MKLNEKTTVVAIIGGAGLMLLLVCMLFGKITVEQFGAATGSLGAFMGVFVGALAGDSNNNSNQ